MPYYEVKVNDEPSVVMGGDDADVTLEMVARRIGPISLKAGGSRRLSTGANQYLDGIDRKLVIGDRVSFALKLTGTAAAPLRSESMSPAELEQRLGELRSQIQSRGRLPSQKHVASGSERSVGFKVSVNGKIVDAPLGEHTQLQLTCRTFAGWKIGELELDSRTVTERGYTRSNRWLTYEIGLGEEVVVTIGS